METTLPKKSPVENKTIYTMKAIQISAPGGAFELVEREIPQPKENEILIKVQACGVCHGETVTKDGAYRGISYPRIPGHEVIGTIVKVGSRVDNWKVGQRVGVGWHGGHCLKCESCRRGDFWACENSLTTGVSIDGGYAEYMIIRDEVVVSIPDELDSIKGAPLLCAGRTTFGALKNSVAKAGDLVVIQGLGGLGHLAVQYSVKMGFKTMVLTHSKEKEQLAYKLGAHVCIDTNSTDAVKEIRKMGGAKVILCLAPDAKAISKLISAAKRDGQIIVVTAVSEPILINPGILFGGASIRGFSAGDIEETLRFSLLSNIIPTIEEFPLEKAAEAYQKMMDSKVHFRAVLKISN